MFNSVRRAAVVPLGMVVGLTITLSTFAGGASAHPPTTIGDEVFVPGNPTCLSLSPQSGLIELKADPPVSGEPYTDGTFSVTVTLTDTAGGQLLGWTSNIGVDSVVVKGGNGANRYTYTPEATADTGLHSPANKSGKYAAVSHVSFCYDVEIPDEGCTRGYWGGSQHFDSWPAGHTPSQTLGSVFTGAPNPTHTLLNALNYGGGPTLDDKKRLLLGQAVPALLNAAHPDVNFPLTEAQVITSTNAALASANATAISDLQAAFDALNNNGCPLN